MISIAMATYNGERFLREQLDSILAQTVTDWELHICDDCSTDSTFSILEEYASNDKRIHVHLNECNLGFKKNFERAISFCTGEYIALSDQDDVWVENHLEVLFKNLDERSLVCSNSEFIDVHGFRTGDYSYPKDFFLSDDINQQFFQVLHINPAQGCTMLFPSSFRESFLPFPDSVKYHDYWIAIIASLQGGIKYLPNILVLYRRHGRNVSSVNSKSLLERAFTDFSVIQYDSFYNKKNWHQALNGLCLSCEKRKDFKDANLFFDFFLENRNRKFAKLYFKSNYKKIYCTPSKKLFFLRYIKNFYLYKEPMHSYISAKSDYKKKNKILITKFDGEQYEGVINYIYNLISLIDLSDTQIDLFISTGDFSKVHVFKTLLSLGVNIFIGTARENHHKYIRDFKCLRTLIKKNHYDAMYVNSGHILFVASHLWVAKLYGVKKRIAHSHNSITARIEKFGFIKTLMHNYGRAYIRNNATVLMACSDVAADWLYGKTLKKKVVFVKNGIDLNKFSFNEEKRTLIRKSYNINTNDILIGLTANFTAQKNHKFLLQVFYEYLKINANAFLLLLGDGEKKESIIDESKNLGIYEKIIFAGSVQNPSDYYSAMDAFVMPSIHEGLPYAGVEAQCSCLPSFFSDSVTREIAVTNYAFFYSLEDSAEKWAKNINSILKSYSESERKNNIKNVEANLRKSGFDFVSTASYVSDFLGTSLVKK